MLSFYFSIEIFPVCILKGKYFLSIKDMFNLYQEEYVKINLPIVILNVFKLIFKHPHFCADI